MERNYTKVLHTDVLVAGAGPAGLCAAIQAARDGHDVTLIEMSDRLGGVMSVCEGMPLGCGYVCCKNIGGMFEEYCNLLTKHEPRAGYLRLMPRKDFGWDIFYNQDMAMYFFYEMLEKAGVHLILNAITGDVLTDGNRVTGVEYHDMTGCSLVEAKIYIDCTGNGDVGCRAGIPYDLGDENGAFMTYTMSFVLANVDEEVVIDKNDGENGYADPTPLIEAGIVGPELTHLQFCKMNDPGRFHVNYLRERGVNGLDPDDLLKRSNEARRRIVRIYEWLRKNVPGFENSYLDGIGPLLGVRDTRRLEGMYKLTVDDIFNGEKFRDEGVVCCDNPIDEVGRDKVGDIKYIHIGEHCKHFYRIPFHCFVPKTVENVLFAGKILCSEPKAQASARGMGTCFGMGQAVGYAAGVAIDKGITVQQIDSSEIVDGMIKLGMHGLRDEMMYDL